ncbi:MAG: prepilin-type N-terminal cleavage/methylation protein [Actinomycetia bacterium]|nr:prepilin-type N-terminal cleavage/methylation protein [Actinomycetes bacterium]
MKQALAGLKRRKDSDEGFTLIELMVVVLIIAILIAIAIPTFLGARSRAQDKSAQSSLRNSLTAAKTIYTDSEDYSKATPAALLGVEPSLAFVDATTGSAGPKSVSVSATTSVIAMAAVSSSGKCYVIRDNVGPASTGNPQGTTFGTFTSNPATGACQPPADPTATTGITYAAQW